jgi:archaemetzincin
VDRVDVLPVGDAPEEIVRAMEACLVERLGLEPRRRPWIEVPPEAFDARRRQHASARLLQEAHRLRDPGSLRILAVTEADLFIPMLTFVFGQAQLGGAAAIVSLARLRQEFYGLPADDGLLARRAAKEALHEMGHTFGITHCEDPACAMSLSTSVHQIDTKDAGFCPDCALLLEEVRRAGGIEASVTAEVRP